MVILLTTSGCWDSLNIEDRDICTTVVVDKDDDNYIFYVEVPDISMNFQNPQSEGGQGIKTSIVKGSGKSYAEARASLDRALNKTIYLGAVQSLILTERLAESGIDEYAMRLRQLTDYRKTMDVIITPDKPEDFLAVHPSNEATVGFAIEDSLENMSTLGISYHLSLADLLQKLSSANPCYLVNTLAVKDGQIVLIGNTVFSGGRRIGFIPFEESRGAVILLSHGRQKPKFDYVVGTEDKTVTLETKLKGKKITAAYDGEKASFELSLNFEAMELYPSCRMTVSKETESQLKEHLEAQIRDDIQETIEKSQKEYECDYLSFSEPFRISFPEAYEKMNWEDEFKKAEFNVNVSVKLKPNRSFDYKPTPII